MNDSVKYLIPVGFYREFRGGKPHEPSLREVIQAEASPEEAIMLRYLNDGNPLIASGGVVGDVLDTRFGIIGPPHILTDGKYAWPATLAHYLMRYHVRLPADFVLHMIANNWTVPAGINVHSLQIDRDRLVKE